MESQEKGLTIPEQQIQIASKIDAIVSFVQNEEISGFQRAFVQASAIEKISELLTAEYMKPIMTLQNKKIGFLTDLKTGYTEEKVKEIITEVVLNGLEVTGNQFNIIASKMYVTKEGFKALLKKVSKLSYQWIPDIPIFENGGATVKGRAVFNYNGKSESQELIFPVKVNQGMSSDGVMGKAERKALSWIYFHVTGIQVPEGDINDQEPINITSSNQSSTKREERKEAEDIQYEDVKETSGPASHTMREYNERENRALNYLQKATDEDDWNRRIVDAKKVETLTELDFKTAKDQWQFVLQKSANQQ